MPKRKQRQEPTLEKWSEDLAEEDWKVDAWRAMERERQRDEAVRQYDKWVKRGMKPLSNRQARDPLTKVDKQQIQHWDILPPDTPCSLRVAEILLGMGRSTIWQLTRRHKLIKSPIKAAGEGVKPTIQFTKADILNCRRIIQEEGAR